MNALVNLVNTVAYVRILSTATNADVDLEHRAQTVNTTSMNVPAIRAEMELCVLMELIPIIASVCLVSQVC